jgi:hypothetical protein
MTNQPVVPDEGTGLASQGQEANPPEQITPAPGASSVADGIKPEDIATKQDLEEIRKWMKSTTDGSESRLRKEVETGLKAIDERVRELQLAGVEVTPKEIEAARSRVKQDVLNQPVSPQEADSPPAVQLTAEQQATAKRVSDGIKAIMEEVGVELFTQDPEAKGLDTIHDPDLFLEVFKTKAQAKKERVGQEAQQAATSTQPTTPETNQPKPSVNPSITAGGGAVNNIAEITDTDELFRISREQGKL